MGAPALAVALYLHTRWLRREMEGRRAAEAHIAELANYDPLTGLANRRMFQGEFAKRLRAAGAPGLSLLIIDLDRFKNVNDLHGRETGDQLLQTIGHRLRARVRTEDLVARLGGDEFAIVIEGHTDTESQIRSAQRLLAAIGGVVTIGATRLTVTASIGVATFPHDGASAELLLQRADHAMYHAKAAGRNRHAFFDASLDEAFRDRLLLEAQLREALDPDGGEPEGRVPEGRVPEGGAPDGGAIMPYFQPLVDLGTRRILGFEVLARWKHPDRGVLGAGFFVPIAEDTGLVDRLFMVILRRACLDAVSWDPALVIAVNVSPTQFKDRDLVEKILAVLEETRFPPGRLEIEITENALVQDFDGARAIIGGLKQSGIRVTLDDFGTGFSSLRHLHELPLDKIKIDRSFVMKRTSGRNAETIIGSMIGLGHSLGMAVTGEGIELQSDADWLHQRGCDQGQGHLFSEPLPAAAVPGLVAGGLPPPA